LFSFLFFSFQNKKRYINFATRGKLGGVVHSRSFRQAQRKRKMPTAFTGKGNHSNYGI
jgi:hypothetical protein